MKIYENILVIKAYQSLYGPHQLVLKTFYVKDQGLYPSFICLSLVATMTLTVNHKTINAPSFSFHFIHKFKLKLQELLVCIKLKTYPSLT